MKSIKDLREQYDLITEKEENDMNKLTQLVRAGLFDAKKLSALKRAMDKPADKMTAQEKRMLINLLDALMSEVLSDKQVYRKIKQDVMMKESKIEKKGMVAKDVTNIPSVILLKRKALRAFPDGQKVGLYYAQAIDKFVTIPFNEIGIGDINEEISLEEGLWDKIKGLGRSVANAISSSANSESSSSSSSQSGSKYYEPMSSKLAAPVVGSGSKGGEDSGVSPALLSWERQRYRQSLQTEDALDFLDREFERRGTTSPSLGVPYGYGRRRAIVGGAARRASDAEGKRLGTRRVGKTTYYTQIDPKKFAADQAKKGFGTTGSVSRPVRKPVEKPKPETRPDRPDRRREKPFEDPRTVPPRPTKPERKPDQKPETKPERKPDQKPETRPERKPDQKPETRPERKPDQKPETRPETKQSQSQGRQTRPRTDRGTKAKRIAAAAAGLGILGSLAANAANAKDDEKKFYSSKESRFKPTIADPKYAEPDAAVKSLERKLFRQSMMEAVDLDGNVFELNNNAASKVKTLYESLNKKNKKKMVDMMKESDESLRKVISFAVRQ